MQHDVVIIGGGLAGATIAIQIAQERPDTRIAVLERHAFPVPESAHKVGESSVEIGSHYYNEVLGLGHALIESKIPKLGLRYFFANSDNTQIEQRPELGQTHYHAVGSTQFDRGRQENILRSECIDRGICFIDSAKVTETRLAEPDTEQAHTIRYERESTEHEISARWLIDASGRRRWLARRLDLHQPNEHRVSASWWRIDEPIAVDHMSSDREWGRRVPFGMRRLSTNHFMGKGYWVWLIPLASGSISIGIVAADPHHDFKEINTLDRSLAWLAEHEPGILEAIEPHRDRILDFRTQKNFSYGATQVFSPNRWALTGEAGVFLDPFYSPGSDFIALGNGFVSELVVRDLAGEDVRALAKAYDRQFLSLYRSFLSLYEGQYGMFGNPQVMALKIVLDYSGYWGSTALLYFTEKLTDGAFMRSVTVEVVRVYRLTIAAQRLFRQWNEIDDGAWAKPRMLNYQTVGYLAQWQADLLRKYTDDELRVALTENRKVLEIVVGWLYQRATGSTEAVDPYRVQLRPEDVVDPVRSLNMLEDLDAYVRARTEIRDGLWCVLDEPRAAQSA